MAKDIYTQHLDALYGVLRALGAHRCVIAPGNDRAFDGGKYLSSLPKKALKIDSFCAKAEGILDSNDNLALNTPEFKSTISALVLEYTGGNKASKKDFKLGEEHLY